MVLLLLVCGYFKCSNQAPQRLWPVVSHTPHPTCPPGLLSSDRSQLPGNSRPPARYACAGIFRSLSWARSEPTIPGVLAGCAGGGSAQLPCFCVGGRAFCVSSPQTRQANGELRQRRIRPQSTLHPASSGGVLVLLAARSLAQLMWAAAEAAATWTWVIQPLRGSRGEKATNQAWTSAPCVQSSNNSAFGARSTRWPLIFRARRSDVTHQQATAPPP